MTSPSQRPGNGRPDGDGREEKLLEFIYAHPDLDSFRGNPARLLDAFHEYADKHARMMHIGPVKGEKIVEQIHRVKPAHMAEFGGYMGYSAILFGAAVRQANPDGVYWSLEYNPLYASIAGNLVSLAGLDGTVKVITGPAADSLARLHDEGAVPHLDALFMDHWKDLYLPDFLAVERLGVLHADSLIVADNTESPGAKPYLEHIRGNSKYRTRGLPLPIGRNGEIRDDVEITNVI